MQKRRKKRKVYPRGQVGEKKKRGKRTPGSTKKFKKRGDEIRGIGLEVNKCPKTCQRGNEGGGEMSTAT